MLLGLDLYSLARFELGEADGGLLREPLVLLLADQRLAEGFANHLAGIVV